MPTSDPRPSKSLPRRFKETTSPVPPAQVSVDPETIDTIRLYPTRTPITPQAYLPMRPFSSSSEAQQESEAHEDAIDFATHSWDLKTGGMKTLTAKRELPTRAERRSWESAQEYHEAPLPQNYMFAIIVLVCVVFMLIGGGVVLFVILQP